MYIAAPPRHTPVFDKVTEYSFSKICSMQNRISEALRPIIVSPHGGNAWPSRIGKRINKTSFHGSG